MNAAEADWGVSRAPALRVVPGGGQASAVTDGPGPLDFEAAFRRYAPYVGAIALKILGRDDEVDDVVQDVFIQAHRGLERLEDPTALRAWLARIAVRRARRRLSRQWLRRWLRVEQPPDYESLADPAATPEQRAEVAVAYRLLERLPTDQRVAWVLRQVEGESLERVAELCGCSLSTVQRRLRAAAEFMGRVRHEG